jgi:hypothetical protein
MSRNLRAQSTQVQPDWSPYHLGIEHLENPKCVRPHARAACGPPRVYGWGDESAVRFSLHSIALDLLAAFMSLAAFPLPPPAPHNQS